MIAQWYQSSEQSVPSSSQFVGQLRRLLQEPISARHRIDQQGGWTTPSPSRLFQGRGQPHIFETSHLWWLSLTARESQEGRTKLLRLYAASEHSCWRRHIALTAAWILRVSRINFRSIHRLRIPHQRLWPGRERHRVWWRQEQKECKILRFGRPPKLGQMVSRPLTTPRRTLNACFSSLRICRDQLRVERKDRLHYEFLSAPPYLRVND